MTNVAEQRVESPAKESGNPRLSVTIVARDEAARIGDCIDRVSWADEIIVLDSGSTDGTQDICRARGATVVEASWEGYAAQKNTAIEKARHPWVLSLDADEMVSDALGEQIRAVLRADGPADGFRIPRKNIFFGKWLRHGDHWPDHQVRLFRKGLGQFKSKAVHESVEVSGQVSELTEPLEHHSYRDFREFFDRQVRYAALAAEELHARGQSPAISDFIFRPLWRFVKGYFIKAGWRDGREGFIVSAGYAYYVFMRAAFLWESRRRREIT